MMAIALSRVLRGCFAAALIWAATSPLAAAPPPVGPGDPLEITISNVAAESASSVPIPFGQPFFKGDFPQGVRVSASGNTLPSQVDVKRRYADGSLQFAVISATLDQLTPQTSLPIELTRADAPANSRTAAIEPSDLLRRGFDAVVTFRFPDGALRIVSARKLLEHVGLT